MAQTTAHGFSIDADWSWLYINGERVPPGDRDLMQDENPATGVVVAEIPAGTRDDVDAAFKAAVEAQKEWAQQPPQARSEVIQGVLQGLEAHGEEYAEILIAEGGATHLKAGTELEHIVPGMVANSVSFPTRAQGRTAESVIPGKTNEVQRLPKGVIGVISPWNFPVQLSMRAVAPAIALGNAVVLKPAEETSIAGGLMLAQLFEEAGLPDGVLNVVPGHGSEVGDAVAAHPDCDVVAFTGSTEVGKQVAQRAGEHLALPALELGGNNPHVILEDADLDRAVDAGMYGSFMHQGQVCIAINRHLVHESLYDDYVEKIATRASQLTVGDPTDPETDIGPIINDKQVEEMMDYVERSVEAGATIETGGSNDGRFVEPTVLSGVTNDMTVSCNEHFGPIVPVVPFSSDEEAVELANDVEHGLAASVHSRDIGRARRVAEQIDAGMVHINDQTLNDEPHIPFGGMKDSGVGRYNGESILEEFTEQKWISTQEQPREYPL